MDLQTVLIGLLIFVISALLIYFIAIFTMREKTFEEVMAEQKKRQEEEREKIKSDKKIEKEQLKKKYRKGKGDKSKEKAAQVSEPELPKDSPSKLPQKEHKMVNLEIEPEIIEPSESLVLGGTTQPRNRSGVRKKSILHNKDEVAPIAEKTVELPHKPIKPLDDLELKKLHDAQAHSHESPARKKEKGPSQAEPKQEAKELVKEPVKEVKVQKTRAARVETFDTQQAPAAVMEEKKVYKAKNAAVTDIVPPECSGLIESVRSTKLSEREVQILIEILLNRQGASADSHDAWNKKSQKGDPAATLKKQLEDKEHALQTEQQQAAMANAHCKELRSELTAERAKTAAIEKHFHEKLAAHQAEVEALQARLRHSHEQHMVETSRMQARLQQMEQSTDAALIQKLKQENRILQDSLAKVSTETVPMAEVNNLRQKVSIMEKELSNNAVRLNSAENAKKSSEEKLKKYEEQIKTLESSKKGSEDVLAKKLEEVSGELRRSESRSSQLNGDLKKATKAVTSAESECSSLKAKLQELEKHLSVLDASKDTAAKLQATLQESERKKQELEGNVKNLEKQLADSVRRQDEMVTELQTIRQENWTLTQEVIVTKEKAVALAAAQPVATNGDVHVDNKDFIQISEHERLMAEKVAELSKLKAELDGQSLVLAQLEELGTQLEAQKQKNNELREKNWKAMEALEKAEKSAAEKINKSDKSSREAIMDVEKSDKDILKCLFPAVTVSDKLSHKEWLSAFEKQAAQHISQAAVSQKSIIEKMSHLADENSRLEAEVEVFKNNISILHSEKDRVKELTEETRKLQEQSETYEKQFTQLHAENERLRHLEEENQRLKNSLSANTSLEDEVLRLQEDKQALETRLAEKENNITEAETKLHQLEKVVESEEKMWKEKLRQAEEVADKLRQAQEANEKITDSSREQELEELTVQQQTQIEHYRNVLSNTEIVLLRLETAEKTWEDKLLASQYELQQVRSEYASTQAELQSLRGSTEDLTDLGFAYRCVEKSLTGIVDELNGKIEVLETELRRSTDRLHVLSRENEVLTSKVIVLETQSRAIVQLDTEALRKKVDEILKQLEAEQKKNKDLSSTLVRLNGIIKTGQDALSQEQKLVQQLQEQLSEKSKAAGSSASQEIEQLRMKLNEKEKQLDREIQANKQLSQRLGTASNDVGSTV